MVWIVPFKVPEFLSVHKFYNLDFTFILKYLSHIYNLVNLVLVL